MTKAIKEALEQSLSAWDKYDPYVSRESIVRKANTMAEAIRAALATLQPSGERREAIARIIAPDTFAKFDAELAKGRRAENGRCWAELCYSEVLNAAREKADAILASGFVQNEASIP